jgi:hypothetical protein
MGFDSGPINYDHFYTRCLGAQLKFVWLPKQCGISGKSIWLTHAYKLTAMYTGPGEPVFETRWHDRHEHLVWKIKGN